MERVKGTNLAEEMPNGHATLYASPTGALHSCQLSENVQRFVDAFNQLDHTNLAPADEIYHREVQFQDPAHKIKGIDALKSYLAGMYEEVLSCEFHVHQEVSQENESFISWTMQLSHTKLNQGQMLCVEGASCLKFADNKVIYHRDYFDLGAMLYEHIPLLGRVVRYIKQKLGQ
ncbi:nuclear transport factor 2 family protein [Flocculibacter collagenilyticus]|uniref:nuclear transport factor 2 family protein n=1 Tax=Flocculibacter collagenilyticus TaxID=2744479 RepID=UPI001F34C756|nr:nuclear transport factor 2 family protein [Flocculibacter collagenilyticus]